MSYNNTAIICAMNSSKELLSSQPDIITNGLLLETEINGERRKGPLFVVVADILEDLKPGYSTEKYPFKTVRELSDTLKLDAFKKLADATQKHRASKSVYPVTFTQFFETSNEHTFSSNTRVPGRNNVNGLKHSIVYRKYPYPEQPGQLTAAELRETSSYVTKENSDIIFNSETKGTWNYRTNVDKYGIATPEWETLRIERILPHGKQEWKVEMDWEHKFVSISEITHTPAVDVVTSSLTCYTFDSTGLLIPSE